MNNFPQNPYYQGYQMQPQSPYNFMNQQNNRLQAMEQMYQPNGYPLPQPPNQMNNMPQMQNQNVQVNGLKGRAVSSIDEVKGSIIDLDGSLFIFPDLGNNKIHTKQINLDGTASIKTYSLDSGDKKEDNVIKMDLSNYVDKSELNALIEIFNGEIDSLKNALNKANEDIKKVGGTKHV